MIFVKYCLFVSDRHENCHDRQKYMKGTSDNKKKENKPPLKLNFKEGIFLSILLSDASTSIFGDRSR